MTYQTFLEARRQAPMWHGFDPVWMPDFLFGFQKHLVDWALRLGRASIFADCGLGKTPMQLVWAENVVRKTNKQVLILTPLAVGAQTVREAEKFHIDARQSRDGTVMPNITVTNYQQLHKFQWQDFSGVVCDESSILKNFDGEIKSQVTAFMRKLPYRLLCTATAAPNDYIELGTSSEALGVMGHIDMLQKYFRNDTGAYAQGGGGNTRWNKGDFGPRWRFRGHAEHDFWRWVCSWARAVRQPADLGYDNNGFLLPELITDEHIVTPSRPRDDLLFDLPAVGLKEQRAERRRSIRERCEKVARLLKSVTTPAVAWCHLNDEGKALTETIPGAVEVTGADSDERKEEVFEAFADGQVPVLVTKPVIAGYGLNWQHCAHQTFFPSHSFEQWYQAIRRSWRFGQTRPVRVDVVASVGEQGVLANLRRKQTQADDMFRHLVALMGDELRHQSVNRFTMPLEVPSWI